MEAGKLRHRVALQRPAYTQNPVTGSQTLTWVTVATVWCHIAPLRAREYIASQATQSEVSAELFIRFRRDVEPTWRAVHMVNGVAYTIYNIQGVLQDAVTGMEHLKLMCRSGVNDGE